MSLKKKKKKSQLQALQRSSPLQFSAERTGTLDKLSETCKTTILPAVNASDKRPRPKSSSDSSWEFCLMGLIISERHFRINSNVLDFQTQTEDQKNQYGVIFPGQRLNWKVPPALGTDTLGFLSAPKPHMAFNTQKTAFWRLSQSMAALRWCITWRTWWSCFTSDMPGGWESVCEERGFMCIWGKCHTQKQNQRSGFPPEKWNIFIQEKQSGLNDI